MRQLIIAFSDQALAQKVRSLLQSHGLEVSAVCASAAQILQSVDRFRGGGLVLCPWQLPDNTALGLIELLPDDFDVLAIVSSRQGMPSAHPGLYPLSQPFQATVLTESIRQLLETRQLSYTSLAPLLESNGRASERASGFSNRSAASSGQIPPAQANGHRMPGAAANYGKARINATDPAVRNGPSTSASDGRLNGEGPHRSAEDQKIIEQAKYLLMNRKQMTEAEAHRYLQKKSMESGVRLVDLARQYL